MAEHTPTTDEIRYRVENDWEPYGDGSFDRWLAQHDAELRAEVERLRAVSAAQPYETERELAVALDEARQQVADLRAGIEALLPGETVNVYAGGGNLVSQRRVVDPDHLRTLLAGSGEQPGEGRGPVRDGWCCWTCADLAAAADLAPAAPDSADVRERVRDVFVNAERRESFGGTDIDALTDAVLAAVGQGVTAVQAWDEGYAAGLRDAPRGEPGGTPNPYRAALCLAEREPCGCAWCCASNAPGVMPGAGHNICPAQKDRAAVRPSGQEQADD